MTENELAFISNVQRQVELVTKADLDPDSNMFMTRLSDEGPSKQPFLPSLRLAPSDPTSGDATKRTSRVFKTAQYSSSKRNTSIQRTSPGRMASSLIPTENLKFSQFLDIIFSSKLSADEIKNETRDYVQIMETNYTEKIKELQVELEKKQKKLQKEVNKTTTKNTATSDMEALFVSCIEHVRKDIIKRRL